MAIDEANPLVSLPLPEVVPTGVDTESPVTPRDERARQSWQELIDHKLIEWGRNPDQLDDEGVEAPRSEILRLAIHLAERFRDEGFPPPHRVVPDPNGGVVFERREQEVSEVYHIWDDGTVEYQRFEGTRLIQRWPICNAPVGE